MVTVGRRSRGLMVSRSDLLILLSRTNENEAKLRECLVVSQAATPGGITPALTEASKSAEVVKIVVGYNGRSRPSDNLANPNDMDASVQRFVIQTTK